MSSLSNIFIFSFSGLSLYCKTVAHNVSGLEEVRVLKALNILYRKPELNVLNFIAILKNKFIPLKK
jgi:hypothetical protein